MLKGKTHKSKESWLPSLLKCQFGESRQRERETETSPVKEKV